MIKRIEEIDMQLKKLKKEKQELLEIPRQIRREQLIEIEVSRITMLFTKEEIKTIIKKIKGEKVWSQ